MKQVNRKSVWRNAFFGIAFTVLAFSPSSALAATFSNYNTAYCDGGTLVGEGDNTLDNGFLHFGWCSTSTGKMTTLTVKYFKDRGSPVNVTFGYEWTNAQGGVTSGRHWDQSSNNVVTVEAGEVWGARFRRDPAEAPPSGYTRCMRGLMKTSDRVYATRVVCD